jgi:hypothetical protein
VTEVHNNIVEGGCTGIPRRQPRPRPPVPGPKMVIISHWRMWAFFAGFFASGFLMGAGLVGWVCS